MNKIPLLVICGPTATGKTALSVALAKKYDGEIINADSMQIYKEMNIGTAKPSLEERQGVPHHLMDFVEIDQRFDVAQYCALAKEAVQQVHQKGKLPILVGGTGLYINTFTRNIQLTRMENDFAYRKELEAFAQEHGAVALHEKLKDIDPESYENIHPNNLPRVIRALEVYKQTGKTIGQHNALSQSQPTPYDSCIIGLNYEDREELYQRIDRRVDKMMEQGLLKEVEKIIQKGYNKKNTAMQAIGYKELLGYFAGDLPLSQAVEDIKRESRRYAKRQLTWFRRDERVQWITLGQDPHVEDMVKQAEEIMKGHWHSLPPFSQPSGDRKTNGSET